MQTFLPYPLYSLSARCLDDKRLGKQRVECLQLLNVLEIGPYQKFNELDPVDKTWIPFSGSFKKGVLGVRKTPWYNHPAAQMWKGFEKSLAIYGLFICDEWRERGYHDTCFNKIQKYVPDYVFRGEDYNGFSTIKWPCPPWLGLDQFHASHRSNLLRKNPDWYKQFNWSEPDDLPYIWPKNNLDKTTTKR